jgi:signal transduction histidine kinase
VESGQYIRDLVSFFKPSTSGVRTLDFPSFINSTTQKISNSMPEHIEFRVSVSSGIRRVTADPDQLFLIIDHCIENSIEAIGGSSGRISVSIDRFPEPYENDLLKKSIRILITDTGPGIKESDIKRIFDPFFTTRPKSKARGLGLSMVYSFVENHNGTIQVSSEPGIRTAFEFCLPIIVD